MDGLFDENALSGDCCVFSRGDKCRRRKGQSTQQRESRSSSLPSSVRLRYKHLHLECAQRFFDGLVRIESQPSPYKP